jgi:hypothetical protein
LCRLALVEIRVLEPGLAKASRALFETSNFDASRGYGEADRQRFEDVWKRALSDFEATARRVLRVDVEDSDLDELTPP